MPDCWRGHKIECIDSIWVYSDTGRKVSSEPDRACGKCGLCSTTEGHDGCVGELPGIMNACCGHGIIEDAYVQFSQNEIVKGAQALKFMGKI